MDIEIVVALIALLSSAVGGLLVAIVNHLFTRKRTETETRKLEAEIDKIRAETEKIKSDTSHALGEASYYDSIKINEKILYDSSKSINDGYDLAARFDSKYEIKQGVILIQGEYDLVYELQTYTYDGRVTSFIPKNEIVSGVRKFHVSCELKVISASYTVAIYLCETPDPEDDRDPYIDDRTVNINDIEWKRTDFYFNTPPDRNYLVGIRAERESGEGGLQIRNLVVKERAS